jgi:hypothetical protein
MLNISKSIVNMYAKGWRPTAGEEELEDFEEESPFDSSIIKRCPTCGCRVHPPCYACLIRKSALMVSSPAAE